MAHGSSLGHLKFMQRAKLREEQKKKALADEEAVKESLKTPAPGAGGRKCIVIMEGDPLPGAGNGRMSFQASTGAAETSKKKSSKKVVGDPASDHKTTDSS